MSDVYSDTVIVCVNAEDETNYCAYLAEFVT